MERDDRRHHGRATRRLIGAACLWLATTTAAAADADIIAVHEVQPGEYISKLAVQYYGNADDWRAIFDANPQLDDPNAVQPGDEIRIPALDADEAATVDDGEPITLVTSNDYHPFADERLREHGLAIRVAVEAFEAAGYAPEVEVVDSWSEVERRTQSTDYDVALPYVHTSERAPYFRFSDPLYPMLSQIFVRAGSNLSPRWRESELAGTSACKPTGYYLQDVRPYMDTGFLGLERADSVADCLEQLAAGEVDFVPVNRFTGWSKIIEASNLDPDDFEHLAKPMARAPLRVMVGRDHPDGERLLRDFDEALDVLESSGRLAEIRADALDDFERRLPEAAEAAVDGVVEPDLPRARDGASDATTLYTANHYEPFADEDLPQGGMSTEIVLWAANDALPAPPRIEVRDSWPDVEAGVRDGDAVAAFPYVRTREREARGFIFSEPLNNMQVEVFVRADDSLETFSGMADLSGRTVCKPAGYYMRDVREALDNELIELLEPRPDTAAGCMEALIDGDADFVSMNPNVAAGAIERADIDADSVRSAGPHARLDLRVMAADTDAGRDFIERIDESLDAMAERGSLEAIEARHRRLFQR